MAKSKKPIEQRTYKTEEARAQAYARSASSKKYNNRKRVTKQKDFSTYWIVDLGPDAPPWLERLENIPGATQSDLIASFGHIKLKGVP